MKRNLRSPVQIAPQERTNSRQLSCQSGSRRHRVAAIALAALWLCSEAASAAAPKWTWEAGKQTNNGAITIKSTDGSTTYTGTQNPTASSVKVNNNVATQPPTVIIPAGGINRWSLYWVDRTVGLP